MVFVRLSPLMTPKRSVALGWIPPSATGISDLDQGVGFVPSNNFNMEWKPISTAPFDRDLEVAVINYDSTHALAFPVRRILGSWINAETKERIEVHPTHWREWQGKP